MNAGHAHVIKMLNLVAHDLGCDYRLFSNRNVAGSRRDHRDNSLAIFLFVPLQNDCPRQFVVLGPTHFLFYCGELLFASPRRKKVAVMLRQSRKYLRQLRWRLALSKYHFRHAYPQRAMMIDLGESQIFKRQMPQALDSFVGRNLSRTDLLEKFANGFRVQRSTRQSALST